MGGSLPRAVLLLLLVGVLVALAVHLFGPGATQPFESVRRGPESCVDCHAGVAAEWRRSGHAVAWSSDALHVAAVRFGGTNDCVACHTPAPILQTAGTPPPARADARGHGVDCIACHELADGTMGAATDRPGAPCRPVRTPTLAEPAFCGRCHRAVHEDWTNAPDALKTSNCLDCHMPVVARPGGRSGRAHGHRPSRSAAEIAKGLTLAVTAAGGFVDAVVGNTIPHNVPGERHFRQLYIELEIRDAAGTVTFTDRQTIKDTTPFRGERTDDRVAAGSALPYRWKLDEAAGTVRVRLLYKLYPRVLDGDATVVLERTVKF